MEWLSRKKVLAGSLTVLTAAVIAVPFIGSTGSTVAGQVAFAADAVVGKGITTEGLGKVYGTPDTLNLNMSVSVTRNDVSSAYNAANAELQKVINSLKSHNVPAKDIQTSGLSINPQYSGGDRPTITGYQVDNQLNAVIHGLKTAGATVTDAIEAGGDAVRVNGLSVSLDEDATLLKQARDRAFADSRAKAEQYASLSGRKLGKPLSIVEAVQGLSNPMPIAYADAASGSKTALPIEAGQQAVGVNVTILWEFS